MTTKTFTNRYPGTCEFCSAHVAKDQGIYTWGDTYCSDNHYEAEVARRETHIAKEEHDLWLRQRDMFIPEMIGKLELADTKVEKLVAKVTDGRDTMIAYLTADETSKMLKELHKIHDRRNRTAVVNQHKLANRCPRCEGQGGSDKWNATNWTCYECGGSGHYTRSR